MKPKPIRFAIAQMNPTVGDCPGNAAKMLSWIERAEKQRSDLIVFPEMSLCGYPVWDLANKKQFVEEGLKHLRRIAAATKGKRVAALVGFIDKGVSHHFPKKVTDPFSFNALAWLERGKVRAVYHKRLLPTYDVFLENIFFRSGKENVTVPWKGLRVGLTICEDIWDDRYDVKPLAELKKNKADLVINIAASPYFSGVSKTRDQLLRRHTKQYRFPILYVNQIGGQDDLIFDGRSLFCDSRGRVLFRAPAFEEGLFFFDYPSCKDRVSANRDPVSDGAQETYQALVLGVRDYFRKNGFQKAVIGLSGGIDSAIVAAIATDALGKDAVKGVTMPGPFSSDGSWRDSEELAKRLDIAFESRPIKKMYETFLKNDKRISDSGLRVPSLAMENLQARLRGLELMFISNHEGRLVLTTGNKSELAMGYCTLYGDMAGGLAVIGDVYKTEVYRLARYRNSVAPVIPEAVLTKAPSAELRPNQKDQDSLPPYEVLDEILYLYIEKNMSCDEIVNKFQRTVDAGVVIDTVRKVDHNEYKRRQTPPILRVTEKAWFGRRMPITNKFQG